MAQSITHLSLFWPNYKLTERFRAVGCTRLAKNDALLIYHETENQSDPWSSGRSVILTTKEDAMPKAPPRFALLYCAQVHENKLLPRRLVGDVPIG